MRFGDEMKELIIPEWNEKYIDYEKLKEII
jgi:SPX domain protein involved in polyphosphate accumulation